MDNWDTPAIITNAIIEFDTKNISVNMLSVNLLIKSCLTRHIEFRFLNKIDTVSITHILGEINQLELFSYCLVFCNGVEDVESFLMQLQSHYKMFRTIVYNANSEQVIETGKGGWGNIFLLKESFTVTGCGQISPIYFCNNIEHITESQQHNTCLNRKIAIDAEGNIKNCPSMTKSYGNIKDTKLIEVVNNPEFQKLWYIHKDKISVCRDCEFRHICTDCRAYLENPEDIYSKPLKCGYNPYTGEWEEWSSNPLKQQTMDYYKTK
ncbi:MAG: grasp-with-spasm system SPASM domain peptide maturase [Bacteroidetes bacterium]|nr:grasp-with-spasm system SPASM domain peptide maturase [Bacteroidota bacterium]